MPQLSQAEFTRATRGAVVVPGADADIEPIIAGIGSQARAALRKVHRETPTRALAYYDGCVATHAGGPAWSTAQAYRTGLNRYIAWNAAIGQATRPEGIDIRLTVPFGPDNDVRACAHAIVTDGLGGSEARIVLWDELRLDRRSAEMIALPVLEAADAEYGAGSTSLVRVWHVAENQRADILPRAAQARRGDIQALIAGL